MNIFTTAYSNTRSYPTLNRYVPDGVCEHTIDIYNEEGEEGEQLFYEEVYRKVQHFLQERGRV